MIDLHCHVLPGIDDGPTTIESSLALARAAVAAGTRTLVATPHVSWRYPNSAQDIAQLVAELNERLLAEKVALEVRTGAEIALTRAADISTEELGDLGLGGGPWLLVEPPFGPVVSGLDALVLAIQGQGHRIVLAHPERCPAFHRDPEMLAGLVDRGVITSITSGSLVGQFGERARRFALSLVQRGMVHNVASDAHDDTQRPPSVSAELERSGLAPLAEWLTCAVPAAILEGSDTIPPRPPVSLQGTASASRSWWHLRG